MYVYRGSMEYWIPHSMYVYRGSMDNVWTDVDDGTQHGFHDINACNDMNYNIDMGGCEIPEGEQFAILVPEVHLLCVAYITLVFLNWSHVFGFGCRGLTMHILRWLHHRPLPKSAART
jgi:hypothetical protein